jgi:uncharacterized membrane protein YraQ (UPF0718 family)
MTGRGGFIKSRIIQALKHTLFTVKIILPMLFAVIGLVGLFKVYVTPQMMHRFFNGTPLHDMLSGVAFGAISVGQPFVSYIIGGELLKTGASFYGVSAFILSFVTLGIVQLPIEFGIFGWRFTVMRNLLSLLFAFIIAFCVTVIVGVLQ